MSESHAKPVYSCESWEVDLARRELRLRGAPVPIGGRAFEIFEVLVQSAGEVVRKHDLIDRVWPGAIVEENSLQFHISAIRKALGSDRGMLKTVFGQGYRLLGDWTLNEVKGSPRAGAKIRPERSRKPFLNNLPVAASQLIGRAAALKQVQAAFSAYRVVTLIGPGGVGKTALALEAARGLFSTFEGDVAIVELASLSDPNLVPSVVATTLNLQFGGDKLCPRSLAQSIGRKKLLLVLDNCEHLIAAAAELAEAIVRMCPQTSILATSREPLRIEGEYVYRVPPLDVPESVSNDRSDVLRHGAVQFFISKTKYHSSFSPLEDNLQAIAEICRRLDGMPLAIEFAAGHAATLGVQHIADRLKDRIDLLTGGRRTALPRHQTLRATFDWSYQLLSEREQYLLRHLAIFPAGFTLEAACAMSDGDEDVAQIEEHISGLVWKSLLSVDESADGIRWRFLQTTRAYALGKLAEHGEAEQAARRHAVFFRNQFARAVDTQLVALEDVPRYVREIDNVRAALDWAFSPGGDKAVGIALTAAYAPVWLHLSLIAECRSRIERARDNLTTDTDLTRSLKAQLLIILGIVLVYTAGASERTELALVEAQEIAEDLADPEAQLQALYAIWIYRFNNGEHRTAQALCERFALIAPRTGDPADILVADRIVGSTHHYAGNQKQAENYFESLLNRLTASSSRRRVMWLHYDGRVLPQARLARVLWMRGLAERAIQVARASLEEAQVADHKLSMCFALGEAVCPLHLMAGDVEAADHYITILADIAEQHGFAYWLRFANCLEGTLLIMRGDAARGSELLRSALEDMDSAGQTLHCSGIVGYFAAALASLGNAVEASTTIDNAIAQSTREGVLWHMPELLRVKGELLFHQRDDQALSAAEGLFLKATEIAQEQAALFWELRTAISLARLKIHQLQPTEARKLLTMISRAFPAETDFSDLRTARELLDSLPLPPTKTSSPRGTGKFLIAI